MISFFVVLRCSFSMFTKYIPFGNSLTTISFELLSLITCPNALIKDILWDENTDYSELAEVISKPLELAMKSYEKSQSIKQTP